MKAGTHGKVLFYGSDPDTDVKVAFNFVPTVVKALMITTAISAAIRPNSIAVAAPSSKKKDLRSRICASVAVHQAKRSALKGF
jgi:hypothetical protein